MVSGTFGSIVKFVPCTSCGWVGAICWLKFIVIDVMLVGVGFVSAEPVAGDVVVIAIALTVWNVVFCAGTAMLIPSVAQAPNSPPGHSLGLVASIVNV